MINKINLIGLGDLLTFAESECGYGWNNFHAMLEKDRIIPYNESPLWDLYVGVGIDYGWSPEVSDVINKLCLSYPHAITIDLSDY